MKTKARILACIVCVLLTAVVMLGFTSCADLGGLGGATSAPETTKESTPAATTPAETPKESKPTETESVETEAPDESTPESEAPAETPKESEPAETEPVETEKPDESTPESETPAESPAESTPEDECDHVAENGTVFSPPELSKYGNFIYYYSCDCGKEKVIDIEKSVMECAYEYVEEKEAVSSDGSTYTIATATCNRCGVEMYMEYRIVEEDGAQIMKCVYTFSYKGTVLIEGLKLDMNIGTPGPETDPHETKPVEPATKPAESEKPIEPATKPAESSEKPVEPDTKPAESEKPVEPDTKPAESEKPIEPDTKPAESEKPVEPDTKPVASDEPVEPATKPAESEKPIEPDTKPVETEVPGEPETKPAETKPAESDKPVEPDTKPAESEKPVEPDTEPVASDEPVEPDTKPAESSDKPTDPDEPECDGEPISTKRLVIRCTDKGTIYYSVCACGEHKVLDENKSELFCDLRIIDSFEEEDENGVVYTYVIEECHDYCGLTVYTTYWSERTADGLTVFHFTYTFEIHGEIILEGVTLDRYDVDPEETDPVETKPTYPETDPVETGVPGEPETEPVETEPVETKPTYPETDPIETKPVEPETEPEEDPSMRPEIDLPDDVEIGYIFGDGPHGEIYPIAKYTPIIDGKLDREYGYSRVVNLRDNGDQYATGVIYYLWDDEALYFHVQIFDSTPVDGEKGIDENSDCIDMFFSLWNFDYGADYIKGRQPSDPGDALFRVFRTKKLSYGETLVDNGIKYADGSHGGFGKWVYDNTDWENPENGSNFIVHSNDENGYYFEGFVKWSPELRDGFTNADGSWNPATIKHGTIIGLGIQVNDDINDDSVRDMVCRSENAGPGEWSMLDNRATCGKFMLVDQNRVPTEPETKPAETKPVEPETKPVYPPETEPVDTPEETMTSPEPPETDVPGEPECDHPYTNLVTVEDARLNICGSTISYYICEDCDTKLMEESSKMNCKFDVIYNDRIFNEDGEMCNIIKLNCPVCGLTMDVSVTLEQYGCSRIFNYVYTLSFGDEIFLADALYSEEREEHLIETEIVDLVADYGCCSGVLIIENCANCDYIKCVHSEGNNCLVEVENEKDLDDLGNVVGYHHRMVCPECGLEVVSDYTMTYPNECITLISGTVSYIVNGEVIVSYVDEKEHINHDYYDAKYVVEDGDCCLGVEITYRCTKCGDEYTDWEYDHPEGMKETTIYFDKYGACGGYITVSACDYCGIRNSIESSFACDFVENKHEVRDAEGNYIGDCQCRVCQNCGLTVHHESLHITDGCYSSYGTRVRYSIGDTELLLCDVNLEESSNHNHHPRYTLQGETCTEGVTVEFICVDCGDSYTRAYYDHYRTYSEQIMISECGSCYYADICDACGAIVNIIHVDHSFCDIEETTEDIFAEDGTRVGMKTTVICNRCGMKYETVYDIEYQTTCEIRGTKTTELWIGEERRFTVVESFAKVEHDLETTYNMFGDNCDHGYEVVVQCKNCIYNNTYVDYGCRAEYTDKELTDFGVCDGNVSVATCVICGRVADLCDGLECEWECIQIGDSFSKFKCNVCGVVKTDSKVNIPMEGICGVTHTSVYTYEINGEVIFSASVYDGESIFYDHWCAEPIYELVGDSCTDGYIAHYICENCGYEEIEEGNEHVRSDYMYIELGEYGACGGYFDAYGCMICHEIYEIMGFGFVCGEVRKESEEGRTAIIYECAECGLRYVDSERYEQVDACNSKTHYQNTLKINGKVIVDYVITYDNIVHNLETEYEKIGETCDDGYWVIESCTRCDYSDRRMEKGHSMAYTNIELSPFGICCGGYIELYYCQICGEANDYWLNEWCSWVDQEDSTEKYRHSICEICGTERIIVTTDGDRDEYCNYKTTDTVTYFKDGEEICGLESSEMHYNQHEYELTYEPFGDTCADGYSVTEKCKYCDDSKNYNMYDHFTETKTIQLGDHGACGGTIMVTECKVCEEILKIRRRGYYCDTEYAENDILDAEGNVIGTESVESCRHCELVFITRTQKIFITPCEYVTYTENIVMIGEEELARVSTSFESTYHNYKRSYEMVGDTCHDGYIVTETCTECGNSYTWKSYGHINEYNEYRVGDCSVCYAFASVYECVVCGEIFELTCYGDLAETETPVVDVNGNIVGVNKKHTCSECNLVYEDINTTTKIGQCEYESIIVRTVMLGDEALYKYEFSDKYVDHKLAYKAEMKGETCYDGYYLTEYCAECGEVFNESEGEGHYTVYISLKSEELGACHGYIEYYECAVCGWVENMWDSLDCCFETVEYRDGYELRRCTECGLEIYFERIDGERDENCYHLSTVKHSIYIDGKLIVAYEYEEPLYEDHEFEYSYELRGETCGEGYYVLESCKYCDYEYRYEDWGHRYDEKTIYFEDEGFCGGYVCNRVCTICGSDESYTSLNCWFCGVEGDENKEVCQRCGAYSIREYLSEEKDEYCNLITHYNVSYYFGEKHLFDTKISNWNSGHHKYVHTVERYGKTCDDGFLYITTCEDCDYRDTSEYFGHCSDIKHEEIKAEGFCGGSIYTATCICCGEMTDRNASINCWFEYSETTEDGVRVGVCSKCGAVETKKLIGDEMNGCTVYTVEEYTYTFNGETLAVYERRYQNGEVHEYEYGYIMHGATCDDGYSVIGCCVKCGASYEIQDWGHRYNSEYVEWKDEDFCGVTAMIHTCEVCGYTYGDEELFSCSFREIQYEKELGISISICEKCGVIRRGETVSVTGENTCFISVIENVTYIADGVDILRLENCYSSYHCPNEMFECNFIGEKCTDGIEAVIYCECGSISSPERVTAYDHFAAYEMGEIALSEYGCCGGSLRVRCCPCGEVDDYLDLKSLECNGHVREYFEHDAEGNFMAYTVIYSCDDCGLVYEIRYSGDEVSYKLSVGETVIFDYVK